MCTPVGWPWLHVIGGQGASWNLLLLPERPVLHDLASLLIYLSFSTVSLSSKLMVSIWMPNKVIVVAGPSILFTVTGIACPGRVTAAVSPTQPKSAGKKRKLSRYCNWRMMLAFICVQPIASVVAMNRIGAERRPNCRAGSTYTPCCQWIPRRWRSSAWTGTIWYALLKGLPLIRGCQDQVAWWTAPH